MCHYCTVLAYCMSPRYGEDDITHNNTSLYCLYPLLHDAYIQVYSLDNVFPAQKQHIVLGGELPDGHRRRGDGMRENHTNPPGVCLSVCLCLYLRLCVWLAFADSAVLFVPEKHSRMASKRETQTFPGQNMHPTENSRRASTTQQLNDVLQTFAYSPVVIQHDLGKMLGERSV